eukprot:TRINITY_DN19978_c0_g2_i1.p1 TRINITY_DN19978_c0_g2~~TRINITY_DN19978_c0_g2_i1.p1  ORF type:complete len:621 (-),score=115.32 TRINITY_DN19978_c0_g2_i1:135-1997(-)
MPIPNYEEVSSPQEVDAGAQQDVDAGAQQDVDAGDVQLTLTGDANEANGGAVRPTQTGDSQEGTFSMDSKVLSTATERTLSEKLDPEISKAVDIVDCLSGLGKHWTGDISGGLGVAGPGHKDPAQSVEEIDDFLSHDWATWGKLKFITLCYTYNGVPAAIAAIVVAGIFGTISIFVRNLRLLTSYRNIVAGQEYYIDSAGYFGLLSGNLTFIIFLFSWQQIKRFFRRKAYMVFMDKLCIHQTDPELKSKGILGLAGFLKISNRLVILWSPRYFSRLWCVYEIASWMSQGKPLKNIEINPVAEGSFLFCGHLGITTMSCLMVLAARWEDNTYYAAMATAAILAFIFPIHIMRHNVRDLSKMPKQIKEFSFHKAECFCCQVNHIIPGTDINIDCDREVIKTKLNAWFSKGNSKRSPIDLFDSYVKKQLGKHILKRVGGAKVRYLSAVTCCISGMLFFSDRLHMLWTLSGWAAWRLFMYYCTLSFAVFPSILRFVLETALLFNSTVGVLENRFLDVLVTMLACVPTTVPTLGLMGALYTCLKYEVWWPQLLTTIGCVIVTLFLYREDPIAWYQYLCTSKGAPKVTEADGFDDDKDEPEIKVVLKDYASMKKPSGDTDAVLVSI